MADTTVVRSDFYVYALFDPWTGLPFYIGKGRAKRIDAHVTSDRNNPDKAAIVERAKREGVDLPRVRVSINLTEAQAFEHEVAWITALGRKPEGCLVNRLPGGANPPSSSGRKWSDEVRAKMRATALRIGQRPSAACIAAVVAARKGKPAPWSDETKRKRSVSLRAVKRTPEWRAKVSSALKGRAPAPEVLAAHALWLEKRNAEKEARVYVCNQCGCSFKPNRRMQWFCRKSCSSAYSYAHRGLSHDDNFAVKAISGSVKSLRESDKGISQD